MGKEDIPVKYLILFSMIVISYSIILYIITTATNLEELSETMIFMIASMKLKRIIGSFELVGYCIQQSIAKGLLYNIQTGQPYYIVVYPTKQHVAVIINNTLYNTENITSPIKIIYKCQIDETFRQAIATGGPYILIGNLSEYINNMRRIVRCVPSYATYKDMIIIDTVTINPYYL